MNIKRIAGAVILVAGIASIFTSRYIMTQVEDGKGQISSAQKKVDTAGKVFSLTPETNYIGKGITGSAQKKINAGQAEVDYYEQMAGWLKIGGAGLIVVGAGLLIFGRKKKK